MSSRDGNRFKYNRVNVDKCVDIVGHSQTTYNTLIERLQILSLRASKIISTVSYVPLSEI
jgi:hypothetical protein